MNQRPRYLIVPESQSRLSKPALMLLYFAALMLGLFYSLAFVYYATEDDPFLSDSGRTGVVGATP